MKMHLKYLSYVLRHKWYVLIECCKLGVPWRGLLHDLSKFSPREWMPYALTFSSGKWSYNERPKWLVEAFDRAWLSHIHKNPHHPQHWVLREDSGRTIVLPMPDAYRKEMLADWIGASKALGHGPDIRQWYKAQGHKHPFHKETRKWVEEQIYGTADRS